MNYITVMQGMDEVGTYNIKTKKWTNVHWQLWDHKKDVDVTAIGYLDLFGYLHPHPSLTGPYQRNRAGEVVQHEIPKKLNADEVMKIVSRKRMVKEASMANLEKGGISAENRYIPQKIITLEMLLEASQLKAKGLSWREVGCNLNQNPESLRTAINRQQQTAAFCPINPC
jgi:hypothetical protein